MQTKQTVPLTFRRNVLPGGRGVHEGSILDLVIDVFILIERKCPAQADIHNDSHGPHVKGAVVAFTAQHLWSQVGRGAHHRPPERLLADDSGKAKVAQLHLGWRNRILSVHPHTRTSVNTHTHTRILFSLPEERALQKLAVHSQALGHSEQCF